LTSFPFWHLTYVVPNGVNGVLNHNIDGLAGCKAGYIEGKHTIGE
jgi:hypothetical protein